jgi:ribonucleotide monophosphatase NagD (HAD superfamily)
MGYKIASDEQIKKTLKKTLSKLHYVQSQSKLRTLVLNELNKRRKKKFAVSEKRIRTIAARSDFVKIEIRSREGDPQKVLFRCPVCEGSLKRVKNLTIWGGEVTIEFKCPLCGYWTSKKKRIPTLYIFHFRK